MKNLLRKIVCISILVCYAARGEQKDTIERIKIVDPLETLPGGMYEERIKGEAADRMMIVRNREILIYKKEKLLVTHRIAKNLEVGAPIWTKRGLWFAIRNNNNLIKSMAVVVYCDLNSEEQEFKFYDKQFKFDGKAHEVVNLIEGSDEKLKVVCVIKTNEKRSKFVLQNIIKNEMTQVVKSSWETSDK
jgi:hypothetical protein